MARVCGGRGRKAGNKRKWARGRAQGKARGPGSASSPQQRQGVGIIGKGAPAWEGKASKEGGTRECVGGGKGGGRAGGGGRGGGVGQGLWGHCKGARTHTTCPSKQM